ncbi:MAG: hypothetical protein AB1801_04990 [Chloroflexota bacterium]
MHRLQISLTAEQYDFLKSEAFISNKSMAAVLRNVLDHTIQNRRQDLMTNDPIWNVIGVGQDLEGPTDVSTNIDQYLYGDPEDTANRAVPEPKVAESPDEYLTD